jgi:hypothetical protein
MGVHFRNRQKYLQRESFPPDLGEEFLIHREFTIA